MIAKASTISHGANAIRYSVNKEKADIVKANLLPDNISPEAMYGRMMLVQKKYAEKINKGRPLGRNVIRIEISPSEEESRGWTMDDWLRLSNEFIRVFDSIDLSGKTKRDFFTTYQPQELSIHSSSAPGFQKWHSSPTH